MVWEGWGGVYCMTRSVCIDQSITVDTELRNHFMCGGSRQRRSNRRIKLGVMYNMYTQASSSSNQVHVVAYAISSSIYHFHLLFMRAGINTIMLMPMLSLSDAAIRSHSFVRPIVCVLPFLHPIHDPVSMMTYNDRQSTPCQ
jgi:hypothetical protein